MGSDHDVAIVGLGLAGASLAWALAAMGQRVVIIDPGAGPSASRVAAGLVTPITGRRLTAAYTADDLAKVEQFYRAIEAASGAAMFDTGRAVRLLADAAEVDLWRRRRTQADIAMHVLSETLPIDAGRIVAPCGGFVMAAARLDTRVLVAATRACFEVIPRRVDWRADVTVAVDGVVIAGRRVGTVVTCEGWTGGENTFFPGVVISGSRGDVLTVRFEHSASEATLHRGIWIAPAGERLHRVGATFAWTDLEQGPLATARQTLESALGSFVRVNYEVVAHEAGVRPVAKRRDVLMGRSRIDPRIAMFNGLGAKGAIRAARYAPVLAAHLVSGAPIPRAVDVRETAP